MCRNHLGYATTPTKAHELERLNDDPGHCLESDSSRHLTMSCVAEDAYHSEWNQAGGFIRTRPGTRTANNAALVFSAGELQPRAATGGKEPLDESGSFSACDHGNAARPGSDERGHWSLQVLRSFRYARIHPNYLFDNHDGAERWKAHGFIAQGDWLQAPAFAEIPRGRKCAGPQWRRIEEMIADISARGWGPSFTRSALPLWGEERNQQALSTIRRRRTGWQTCA